MVTVSQVQRGFVAFVDNEVAAVFEGWQKAIVAGGAGLLAANLPKLINMYSGNPLIVAMGVFDAESGSIDIDDLYTAFVPKLGASKIPFAIPKIGTIKLGRDELDRLMRYIKEA